MGWKFWKREPNPMDPQQLLNQAHSAPNSSPQDVQRVQDAVPAGAFVMPVEDVFSITGRGTVATGRITAGTVQVGDQVMITRAGQQVAMSRVTGVEAFRKNLTVASAGDNVGLLLEGIDKSQLLSGDVISR
ncbi:EF-Tu/IF-2/RF-3 family GTPase [Kribbella catacumbae]|uniref:EF-Tu/IF-2/RF-3 family GTPase n=1 Tax=Kribbella catacumbae TaxID=460086 RepID=UPI0003678E2F|nr:EF-Tu/IF-2/RF-3 family GTPase [Kribbella catacumbae]